MTSSIIHFEAPSLCSSVQVLVPCLTQCEIVCDPIDALSGCSGLLAKFQRFGFLFVRLRYVGLGMSNSFQQKVLAEGPVADAALAQVAQH